MLKLSPSMRKLKEGDGHEVQTLFYVSNFLENAYVGSICIYFDRFRLVMEVFIPSKRSNFGEHFGFAQFADVNIIHKIQQGFVNIWMGSFKFRVNIARFSRDHQKIHKNFLLVMDLLVVPKLLPVLSLVVVNVVYKVSCTRMWFHRVLLKFIRVKRYLHDHPLFLEDINVLR